MIPDDRLRAAFTAHAAAPRSDCPPPDAIWAAASGEATAAHPAGALLLHVAGCSSCAEDWRVARELVEPAAEAAAEREHAPSNVVSLFPRRRWSSFGVAAALAAALLLFVRGPGDRPEEYRGSEAAFETTQDEGAALRRDDPTLRWSPIPGARSYDVLLAHDSLEPMARARELTAPAWRVPDAALEAAPDGASLIWQVSATLEGGGRIQGPTWTIRVE